MKKPKDWPKNFLSAGGLLGLAIVTARLTRTPLATILAAAPQLLRLLQSYERGQSQNTSPETTSNLTAEEAALILGVPIHANEEQVRDAHRRLIQKNHPDRGGTDYLATKINQARDTLLKAK